MRFGGKRRLRDSGAGFTLIEVLLAMTILAVGLLGMTALTAGILQQSRFSRGITTATTLAQDALEDAVFQGYDALPAADQTTTEGYGAIADYPDYSRALFVDVDSPEVGMKEVFVTVSWQEGQRSVQVNAIVTR